MAYIEVERKKKHVPAVDQTYKWMDRQTDRHRQTDRQPARLCSSYVKN